MSQQTFIKFPHCDSTMLGTWNQSQQQINIIIELRVLTNCKWTSLFIISSLFLCVTDFILESSLFLTAYRMELLTYSLGASHAQLYSTYGLKIWGPCSTEFKS